MCPWKSVEFTLHLNGFQAAKSLRTPDLRKCCEGICRKYKTSQFILPPQKVKHIREIQCARNSGG